VTRTRPPLTPARSLAWLTGLALLLAVCLGLGLLFGSGGFLVPGSLSSVESSILYKVRLPRVLLAAVLGGSLTGAGIVFQALLRNPLADPYVLGVSGGASIGGVLALVTGLGLLLGPLAVPLCAFGGALAALLFIYRIAAVNGRLTVYTVLLTGVIFNAFSGAFIYFIQSVASLQQLHAIVFYLMGSVPSYGYGTIALLFATCLAACAGLFAMTRSYNALSLGEEAAMQLGVDTEGLKRNTFLLGSLLTGLAVAVAGLIGFIGLVVPHLLRLILGPDHRLLLPAGALGGASFLVLADLVSRVVVAPNEIPVGVVTALVGGPFFLVLMKRRGRQHVD